jgi:hypothetical protein
MRQKGILFPMQSSQEFVIGGQGGNQFALLPLHFGKKPLGPAKRLGFVS